MQFIKLSEISRQSIHFWIYFFCLCLFVISLPTSRTLLSSSQILLGINWLIEGNFKLKFDKFFKNTPMLVFSSIILLYLIGLLWTSDLANGITHEVKTKLPILTFTLVVVSSPRLDINKLRILFYLFIASVLTTSLIGLYKYLTTDLSNFRDIAPYASHLYFSMMLIVSAVTLPWLTKQLTHKKVWIIISYALSGWMLFFIFLARSLSGLACLGGVLFFLLIYIFIRYKSLAHSVTAILVFIASISATVWLMLYMFNIVMHEAEVDFSTLERYTKQGNKFVHDTTNTLRENGNLVYLYISEEELKPAWNEASRIDYNSRDLKNHEINHTLLRYMASKGFPKDHEHLKLLTEEDIKAIEKGTTNYLYKDWPGIFVRIHQTMMGVQIYLDTNNPNWSTITQRFELWKASFQAFKNKPLIGWGTGDVYKAVAYGMGKTNTKLDLEQSRSHNQYFILLLKFGIVGFISFFALYSYTVIKTKAYRLLPFKVYLVALAVDMFGNNPLDAQHGLTMFVFFTVLFAKMYRTETQSN